MNFKIEYTGNRVVSITWTNDKHQVHREDGPAFELSCGYKQYRINGLLHRENGPAVICSRGDKHYYIHGKFIKTVMK